MALDNISKHISYKEAIHSETAKKLGIENKPTPSQLARMKLLAENVFEPLRTFFNVPIYISSFFRSKELNEVISVSKTSQHMANNGAAMDIDADTYGKITNKQVFEYLRTNTLFDQLIAEDVKPGEKLGWVHVSYTEQVPNRKQVLVHRIDNGKHYYYPYDKTKGLDIKAYING
jgi:hypothetical protein